MTISNQASDQADKSIDWTTMPSVLNLRNVLELVVDGFDDGALA